MILSKEQIAEMEEAARPLIKWMNTLGNPHVTIIVDVGSANLSEGVARIVDESFIPD